MALSPAAITFGGHVQNFLGQHGYPVLPYTSHVEAPRTPGSTHVAWAHPGRVNWAPDYVAALEKVANRWGKRGRLTPKQVDTVRVALHEGIHQMRYGRTPGVFEGDATKPGTGAYYEEASTEAAARDLLPIFTAKMFGHRIPNADAVTGDYQTETQNFRHLSVFGSGAKNYKQQKARAWRRTFNHADAATRQQMAEAAMKARIASGKPEAKPRSAGAPLIKLPPI